MTSKTTKYGHTANIKENLRHQISNYITDVSDYNTKNLNTNYNHKYTAKYVHGIANIPNLFINT